MMIMKTGEKIRAKRIELNMTMEDLGKAIGVQRSAINKYEKGIVDISSKKLAAIANALNVSIKSLLEDVDDTDETHIVIQNMEQFSHLLQYMTQEEYDFVIAAFDKARERMRAKGIEP
jgi:transcriptional regulator with XRE-family HTH domain